MIVTTRFLNEMFRIWGDPIDKPLEEYLLAIYGEDPFPHEWSEQDLYEQIRKLIIQYSKGELDITIPSAEERQRARYETLKASYLELLSERNRLKEIIESIRKQLKKSCYDSSYDEVF